MKKRTISIGQKLKKVRSRETMRAVVLDWVDRWEKNQTTLLKTLGVAVSQENWDTQCMCVGNLNELTLKSFIGLRNVIEKICDNVPEYLDSTKPSCHDNNVLTDVNGSDTT